MDTDSPPAYRRRERGAPLSFSTKLYQGVGAIPDTVKNWVFTTFTLLFYNQILGMDALLVSVALAIAIGFDAITDPIVASLSDNAKTRWGRRHPWMLASRGYPRARPRRKKNWPNFAVLPELEALEDAIAAPNHQITFGELWECTLCK